MLLVFCSVVLALFARHYSDSALAGEPIDFVPHQFSNSDFWEVSTNSDSHVRTNAP